MDRVHEHASVVYLVSHSGSRANAEALMLAGAALLSAGGFGVKVESSGVAHSPSAWAEMCSELHLFSAHRAYVLNITGPEVYSCGMHNLGLRDAMVENFGTAEAVELIRSFTFYLFTEEPDVKPGQTFSLSATAPVYRILAEQPIEYEVGCLFANQYGFWRLDPA